MIAFELRVLIFLIICLPACPWIFQMLMCTIWQWKRLGMMTFCGVVLSGLLRPQCPETFAMRLQMACFPSCLQFPEELLLHRLRRFPKQLLQQFQQFQFHPAVSQ